MLLLLLLLLCLSGELDVATLPATPTLRAPELIDAFVTLPTAFTEFPVFAVQSSSSSEPISWSTITATTSTTVFTSSFHHPRINPRLVGATKCQ